MPEVARKDGVELVFSPDGSGSECESPTLQRSFQGSGDVFANSIGVVRLGDAMIPHSGPGCGTHAPTLSQGSPNVFANNRQLGRRGDVYGGNHILLTGSPNVFANS